MPDVTSMGAWPRCAGHGRGPAVETFLALLRTELDALAKALRELAEP